MEVKYTQKKVFKVVLWTNVARIEGTTFALQNTCYSTDNRLSDLMNFTSHMFLPITDAKIYSITANELVEETNFININKQHIIMITESKE